MTVLASAQGWITELDVSGDDETSTFAVLCSGSIKQTRSSEAHPAGHGNCCLRVVSMELTEEGLEHKAIRFGASSIF